MREQVAHGLGSLRDWQFDPDTSWCLYCGVHLYNLMEEFPIYQRPSLVDDLVLVKPLVVQVMALGGGISLLAQRIGFLLPHLLHWSRQGLIGFLTGWKEIECCECHESVTTSSPLDLCCKIFHGCRLVTICLGDLLSLTSLQGILVRLP